MPNYDQPNQNVQGLRKSFITLPDDLWPDTRAMACIVRRSRVRVNAQGKTLLKDDTPMQGGVSLYADWELRDPKLDETFGTWVLGTVAGAEGPGEDDVFIWNPPLSAGAMKEPVYEEHITGGYYWPGVLRDANLVLNPRSVGGGDTEFFPVVRRYYHNGRDLPTVFRRRVYASNTPWPESRLRANPPLPTPVNIDAYGVERELGECLHPTIEVEAQDKDDVILLDLVPSVTDEKATAIRALAATNQTGWQRHIARVESRTVNGLYFRIVFEALPPREPVLSVQS
jgi:hypothetical protein